VKFAIQNTGSDEFLAAAFLGELSEVHGLGELSEPIVLSALREMWVKDLSRLLLK